MFRLRFVVCAALLAVTACARGSDAPSGARAGGGLAERCRLARENQESGGLALPTLALDPDAIESTLRAALAEPRRQQRYRAACGAFVADEDAALVRLVGRYLDLNQERFGFIMIKAPGFDDAVVPLREGEAYAFRRRLRGGVSYRLVGACDNECGDVDLLLATAEGELVDHNTRRDNFPYIEITPPEDGDFFAILYLHTCSIEPCYAGVRLLEQRNNWALDPFVSPITLSSGAFDDPQFVELVAGGDVDMRERVSKCVGYVSDRPDTRVIFTVEEGAASQPLLFSVNSDADTTLVINGPDGRWYCGDDGGVLGRNPMVLFEEPQAGQYDIWVGVYGQANTFAEARLAVSQRFSQ